STHWASTSRARVRGCVRLGSLAGALLGGPFSGDALGEVFCADRLTHEIVAADGPHVLYVTRQGDDGASGLSWDHALASPAAPLALAHEGDQIWIAEGTYTTMPVTLPSGVRVLGGFAGNELRPGDRNAAAHPVVLTGRRSSVLSIPPTTASSMISDITFANTY